MSKILSEITPELQDFIKEQKIFFVGTAAQEGRVNVSPKGHDTLRVLGPNKLVWLNLTGSGNETAAHLLQHDRMTIMFCAFDGKPLILRLYGHANIYHERDDEFKKYMSLFEENTGSRQIIELEVDMVQTSCGYAVPLMDFKEERGMLNSWSQKQGKARIESYWEEKNTKSIDGFETKILGD
ncbi:pyridoxamine 5'-phosphate oxidase family protein [Sabulilitoribacter multivorans]|uniref:Pyridoxamine 5'-phosphate oxidase family protein n=1 Tax=Flaviramulus multivorans TaxID=1304750 RepID=A0ABS9IHG5_9FLAO|nr:pyridoxamine 5'-phosphate oxidase family protein [Flaviramulus multivorans]MCF7560201.1 pyridoxamine 5'-phosphate oxidase family protein [Flaviramulus multivorans]